MRANRRECPLQGSAKVTDAETFAGVTPSGRQVLPGMGPSGGGPPRVTRKFEPSLAGGGEKLAVPVPRPRAL